MQRESACCIASATQQVSGRLRRVFVLVKLGQCAPPPPTVTFCRYWLELLNQYSALMRFKPTLHRDAVPLEALMLRPDRWLPHERRTCEVC